MFIVRPCRSDAVVHGTDTTLHCARSSVCVCIYACYLFDRHVFGIVNTAKVVSFFRSSSSCHRRRFVRLLLSQSSSKCTVYACILFMILFVRGIFSFRFFPSTFSRSKCKYTNACKSMATFIYSFSEIIS